MLKNLYHLIIALIILVVVLTLWGLWNRGEEQKEIPSSHQLITVSSHQEGGLIGNPLIVKGEARGNWYFEATFPIVLTDWDGRIIAQSYAEAHGEWMTTEFVPFEGKLEFEEPEDSGDFSDWGHLIFQKANASGLAEHDDAYEIRVRFRE
ncbi:MAG: Gmad2 immunoglobulin-like domain-containing protein [Candidatus Paceibacterota bacterium]